MEQIISFIKEYYLYFIIGGCVVLAIVIALICGAAKTRKNNKKYINELVLRKEKINSIDIKIKLERLKNIGISNPAYSQMYERFNTKYAMIEKELNDLFDHSLESLNQLLNAKKYKNIKVLALETNAKIGEYEEKINEIFATINESLADDDALNEELEALSNRIEKVKEHFLLCGNNANFIKNELNTFFNNINGKEEIFKNYLLRGKFEEARDVLNSINESIVKLEENYEYYPSWFNDINNTIPNEINRLVDYYNAIRKSDYPIQFLGIVTIVNDTKKLFKDVVCKCKALDFSTTGGDIEAIKFALSNCDQGVKNEKENQAIFDSTMNDIYNEAKSLVEEHNKQIREQRNLDQKFVVGNSINNVKNNVEIKYKNLQYSVRALEDSIFAKQSYTYRLSRLKQLKENIEEVKKAMISSDEKYKEFEDTATSAGKIVKKLSFELRCLEIDVKNTKLDKIINKYEYKFNTAFGYVISLNEEATKAQVDVDQIETLSKELNVLVQELKESVAKDINASKEAERLLMLANNYRVNDSSIAKEVTKAEVLYYDGRYQDCIDAINETLKNIER